MKICQNLKSGKYFINIQEVDWNRIKAITPLNQIKILERRLFADEINGSENHFLHHSLISEEQLKAYKDYKRFHRDQKQGFIAKNSSAHPAPVSSIKPRNVNHRQRKVRLTMKTIEIDDQVYTLLQDNANPFEETTPNQVLRRLLGLNKPPTTSELTVNPKVRQSGKISPKADLKVLVENGILQEGQSLFLNYKGQNFSKNFEAKVCKGRLLYEGQSYTMSGLVKEILEKEDAGIPSQAYRGPEYWYTSKGGSIRELWARYLKKGAHNA